MTDNNSKKRMFTSSDESTGALYEDRVVSFVDVLGFRSLLARMPNEPDLFETIRGALESIREHGISSRQAVLLDKSYLPTGLEATGFSDCYTVSARKGSELLIVNLTRQLVLCLLEAGIISRGAIVIGKLYHQHPVVFGQALVDAYELETSATHYPRVLVTEQVVKCIRHLDEKYSTTYSDGIIKDSDGCWFVDVFHVWPRRYLVTTYQGRIPASTEAVEDKLDFSMTLSFLDVFLRIRGHVVEHLLLELRAKQPNLNKLSKLRWLASRFNEAMLRMHTKIEPIDLENPQHEENWNRNEWIRFGRQLRPEKLPFTPEDLIQARSSKRKKKRRS